MPWFFNLAYLLLLAAAAPWLAYSAAVRGKYRSGWAEKLLGRVPVRAGDRPCLWLHAVSVGEVTLLAPLLDLVRREYPGWDCVLSTTTATGLAVARQKYPTLTVCYAPLDFHWAVRAALARIRPTVVVLAELEVWPNLIREAERRGAPVAIINGRLSERSHRGYRWLRGLLRPTFARLALVAAQDAAYAARFRDLGVRPEALCVTGSIKFDGARQDRDNPQTRRLARLAGFAPGDRVLLAGSTQEPEEALALETFRTLAAEEPALRLVIVPRHPERFEAVARLLDASGLRWQRRTALDAAPPDREARVLLVDAVGELGAWWGTATVGFVGGSISLRGGQNMIEPAAYGVATCFGPNTQNFRDVVERLLAREAAEVVYCGGELTAFVQRCLSEPAYARQLGDRARALVGEQLGATRRTLELLAPLVTGRAGRPAGRTAA